MRTKYIQYNLLSLLAVLQGVYSYAQFGHPVYLQDFGLGNSDPNTVGAPLLPGQTGLKYSTEPCPEQGSYSIVRIVGAQPCFNDEWIPLNSDYTSDYNPAASMGNMMLINHPNTGSRIVYVDTVNKNLCPGTEYRFSAAIINVDKPSNCTDPSFPSMNLSVETVTGQVLTFISTGRIGYASYNFGYRFGLYGLSFTMPAGISRLVLKIELNNFNLNNCGDDFAIDDIKLTAAGPETEIEFGGIYANNYVVSLCFQDNKAVPMNGTIGPGYTNTAIQWQQSADDGITWADIPGATNQYYTPSFSVPDTFLFRMSVAEAANISNPNCRVISNAMKVEVDGIPKNFGLASNSPVCSGQDLKLDATEGFASYSWNGPNGFTDNSPFAHIAKSTLADSGWYYVQLTTLGGCVVSDSTKVSMIGTDVTAGPDTSVCKGSSVRLWSKASNTAVNYSWSPSNSLSDAAIASPVATPESSMIYTVSVTDNFGCVNAASVNIKLLNTVAVKAVIEGSAYVCRRYDSAFFRDMSLGKITSWNWDFRNGQTSTLPNPPVQQYFIDDNVANYPISLAVMDTAGCTDTAYHFLKVADNCYIAVPSAFTPNNDGLNDYLYPLNAYKATDLLFSVYNRYGQLIFMTRDWTRKWDGSFKGMLQATGVYVWTLEYTDEKRKRISLRGTTTLIR